MVRQSIFSGALKVAIVIGSVLDIYPLLLAAASAVFLALTLTTLLAFPIDMLLDEIGVRRGLFPHGFFRDLAIVNFTTVPKILAIAVAPILIVSVRQLRLCPPSTPLWFAFGLIFAAAGVAFWDYLSASGAAILGTSDSDVTDTTLGWLGRVLGVWEPDMSTSLGVGIYALWGALVMSTLAIIPVMAISLIGLLFGVIRIGGTRFGRSSPVLHGLNSATHDALSFNTARSALRIILSLCIFALIYIVDRLLPTTFPKIVDRFLTNRLDTDLPDTFYALYAAQPLAFAAVLLVPLALMALSCALVTVRLILTMAAGAAFFVAGLAFAHAGAPVPGAVLAVASSLLLLVAPCLAALRHVTQTILQFVRRHRLEAAKAYHADDRKVLLLRPFHADDIRVRNRRSLVGRLTPMDVPDTPLEEVIAAVVCGVAPVVAVAKPGDDRPPLGAMREYLADEAWQPFVRTEIDQCERIVFIAGSATFTKWETDAVLAAGALGKLILIMPPEGERAAGYFAENPELAITMGLSHQIIDEIGRGHVRCISMRDGLCTVVRNRFANALDYRLALERVL